jgi:hypothetical protein
LKDGTVIGEGLAQQGSLSKSDAKSRVIILLTMVRKIPIRLIDPLTALNCEKE